MGTWRAQANGASINDWREILSSVSDNLKYILLLLIGNEYSGDGGALCDATVRSVSSECTEYS